MSFSCKKVVTYYYSKNIESRRLTSKGFLQNIIIKNVYIIW